MVHQQRKLGQKIRAEEDEDPVRENAKEKEVDPCAMMMDTTMFDETNPMLEWLNEDEEHAIFDGSEAASAVLEKIRLLNSSRKANLGRKDNSRKRTRAVEEEEDDDYQDCEDDDEEENECIDVDDDSDSEDDSAREAGGGVPSEAKEDGANQVENVIEGTSNVSLGNRRSGRFKQAKKVKDVNSLYY